MSEKVCVLGCREYKAELLDEVMEKHFALLGLDDILNSGMKVLIKPNLVMRRRPGEATTTHPEFVAALVRALRKRGAAVTIAESPGGPYTRAMLRMIYETTGMEAVSKSTGASLNYDTGYRGVFSKEGKVCRSFHIIKPVLDADLVISAAKLKTHAMMNFSGAVKNLFGSVPGLMKPEFHYRYQDAAMFGEMIVDLCETIKPAVSFLDGIVGMEGDGPTGGSPRFAGVTLSSRNPHALDLLAAEIAGFKAEEVPTLKAAVNRGLCPGSPEQLDVAGDDYKRFILKNFKKPRSKGLDFVEKLPPFLRKPMDRLLTPRPAIRESTCAGCGKCAESCPEKAISVRNGKASIDSSRCIRCFCCHEMCPIKSIDIRRMRLFGK